MLRRQRNKYLLWFLGMALINLGIGMLIGLLIPYCGYLVSISLIIIGIWLVYSYKC